MSLEVAALRALAHPLRLQMLSLLTGASMSAAEVARELDTTQANASYHLRALRAAGLVEDAGEEVVRGGVAKRYRCAPAEARSADPADIRAYAEVLGAELVRRTALRRLDTEAANADAELWVPPEVWADVRERVVAAMTELHAAARPPRTEGTIRTSSTVSLFEMEGGR